MINLLKKNTDLYKSKYKDIDQDQIERIQDFMSKKNFTDKDIRKFNDRLKHAMNVERETVKIVLYIIPESTPRPRYNFKGHNFYVKNASTNNQFMKLLVRKEESLQHYIVTPCEFTCRMYFPIPSDMNKVDTLLAEMGAIRPPIQKDWDNLGKTYSDMIQKWLLLNDALIVKGTSEKYWSLKPRVEIEITYLKEMDCKYNEKKILNSKQYKDLSEGESL